MNGTDGTDTISSIYHRVSIRAYADREVEKEKILEILRAGMQAPSAGDQQPWEFYVVTDREKIRELAACSPYAKCAAGAPVVLVPVYRKKGLHFPEYARIDLSACQENMWLMADALGLGGVWLGIAPMEDRMERVRKVLDLPEDVEAFSLFPVGYPGKMHPQEDRFDASRIHWDEQ